MNKVFIYIAVSAFSMGIAMPVFADDKNVPTFPEIDKAVRTLEDVRQDMSNVKSGKYSFGGHMDKVLDSINVAIKQLNKSKEYVEAHPDGEVKKEKKGK